MTTPPPRPSTADDPVRAKRRQIARYSLIANRIGYLLWALAIATFVLGFAFGFTTMVSTVTIACLVAGMVLLLPTIIIGYAVKAAERDDRQRGV
jgi:hypothetical protein